MSEQKSEGAHRQEVIDALADLTSIAIQELRRALSSLPPQERHKLALQLYGLAVRQVFAKPPDDGESDRKAMQEKFDQLLAGVLGK